MSDITARQLVDAASTTLGLDGITSETTTFGEAHHSRGVLLHFSDVVREPVFVTARVTPTELVLSAERYRVMVSGIDVERVLREGGDSSLPKLCASVTLTRGAGMAQIEKRMAEGAADLVFERGMVRMGEGSTDDVVEWMVASLLHTMDRLGRGASGLKWTSMEFRPRPIGGASRPIALVAFTIGASYFLVRQLGFRPFNG